MAKKKRTTKKGTTKKRAYKKRAGPVVPRGRRTNYADRFPGAREIEPPGGWMEWKTIGQECVGVFMGMEPFRNGFKTTMDTPDDGLVIFSTPKMLKASLDVVEIGQRLAIVYTGPGRDTGKGEPLKEFKVFVLDKK
jgi:hypothetical protein